MTIEAFRKQSPIMNQSTDDFTKRIASVDTLAVNKDKKLLFNKIETMDDEYYPFGTPGGGAPLKDSNNDLLSRLPNIHQNLWNKSHGVNLENKKKEINEIIDKYSQKKHEEILFDGSSDPFFAQRRQKYAQIQLKLDPVKRSHIKPDTYWNDWFGRPGAGAPNRSYYKQDLDNMLEPNFNKNLFLAPSIDNIEPYNPSRSLIRKNYRSDHHNRYELTPR